VRAREGEKGSLLRLATGDLRMGGGSRCTLPHRPPGCRVSVRAWEVIPADAGKEGKADVRTHKGRKREAAGICE
jgi:hypothetical protein